MWENITKIKILFIFDKLIIYINTKTYHLSLKYNLILLINFKNNNYFYLYIQ